MENRLKFLYHLVFVMSKGVTQEDKESVRMEVYVQIVRESDRQIRLTCILSYDGE